MDAKTAIKAIINAGGDFEFSSYAGAGDEITVLRLGPLSVAEFREIFKRKGLAKLAAKLSRGRGADPVGGLGPFLGQKSN